MATLKEIIGISQSSASSISSSSTGVGLGVYSSGGKYSPNILEEGDYILDKSYLLLSFALSRTDLEKVASRFNKPLLSLVIQGKDYNENPIVKTVYTNKGTAYNFACEWNGNYGIMRVTVSRSTLIKMSVITHIGVVISRESSEDGSDAIGKIFRINNTITTASDLTESFYNNSKLSGLNKNIFSSVKDIKTLSNITSISGNPAPSGNINLENRSIAIAPIDLSNNLPYFRGVSDDKKYLNEKYHNKKIRIYFRHLTSVGYPSFYQIDNGSMNSSSGSYQDYEFSKTTSFQPKVVLVYGGYKYTIEKDDFESTKLEYYTKFGNFSSEQDFSSFFSFNGKRYSTKFVEYQEGGIKLLTGVIDGTITQKENKICPFEIPSQLCSSESKEYILTTESNTLIEKNSNIELANCVNLFTKDEQKLEINLPLIDEYNYYALNFGMLLNGKNQTTNPEIIVYSGQDLIDNISSTELSGTGLSNIELVSVIEGTPKKVEKPELSWETVTSEIPYGENIDDSPSGSYFEYRRQKVKVKTKDVTEETKDVTEETKFENKFEYYTILHCRAFPQNNDNDIITELKIQDGKLYYKINDGGLGDWNSKFSANQFINYAISGNHAIGLSNTTRKEVLYIYSQDNTLISSLRVGSTEPYDKLLKLFYTGIVQSLPLSQEVISGLSGVSSVSLKIAYGLPSEKEGELSYTIFSMELPNIPIISGTRPLAFRKEGIIVNPRTQDENLDEGTSVRINLKTVREEDNKAIGKAIEIIACDESGNPIEDSDSCVIEYRREADSNGQFSGNFYFDGVNLKNLNNIYLDQNTAENTYLKKNDASSTYLDKNSAASTYQTKLTSYQANFLTSTILNSEDLNLNTWGSKDLEFVINNSGVPNNAILSGVFMYSSITEGNISNASSDVTDFTLKSYSIEDGTITGTCRVRYYARTTAAYKWKAQVGGTLIFLA